MKEKKIYESIGFLGFIICILIVYTIKLNKSLNKLKIKVKNLNQEIKATKDSLDALAILFSKFLDQDAAEKRDLERLCLGLPSIDEIIDNVSKMSWKDFADSDYYNNPSKYFDPTGEKGSLLARSELYFFIIANIIVTIDPVKFILNLIKINDLKDEINKIENCTLNDMSIVFGSKKEYLNELERILKENIWDLKDYKDIKLHM